MSADAAGDAAGGAAGDAAGGAAGDAAGGALTPIRFLRCGDDAVLLEVAHVQQVLGLDAALREDPPPGVVEHVPAARTVLVRFDARVVTRDRLTADLARLAGRAAPPAGAAATVVEIPVRYDGADLAAVARHTGLPERAVVALHTAGEYVAAFCGFAPGFAYLTGLDAVLHVPRLATPRTTVPAGSVAIAGEFTGVYPRAAPGGWHLLGRTDRTLWDVSRNPPALLPPGTRVRFVEVRE